MRFGIQLQFLLLIGIFKESYTRKIDDVQSIHPPIDMERGPAQDTISRSKLLHLINFYANIFGPKRCFNHLYSLISLGL